MCKFVELEIKVTHAVLLPSWNRGTKTFLKLRYGDGHEKIKFKLFYETVVKIFYKDRSVCQISSKNCQNSDVSPNSGNRAASNFSHPLSNTTRNYGHLLLPLIYTDLKVT